MKPIWLFEADVFGAAAEPLKAEVRRQGMAGHIVRQPDLFRDPLSVVGGTPLPDGSCVIFYGSHPLMRHIQLHRRWVPGGWCSFDRLDCAAYYPHLGRFLLNADHALLPGIDAITRRDELFARFGSDGEVFVRPSPTRKLFTGRRVGYRDFPDALAPSRYDPATFVVVAAPRTVEREWRLVVADGEVVAASRYATGGARDFAAGCPPAVVAFADRMLVEVPWRPDEVFGADVCESEGGLFLLELNGFSCSGLYLCDPRPVVAAAGAVAARAWERATGT